MSWIPYLADDFEALQSTFTVSASSRLSIWQLVALHTENENVPPIVALPATAGTNGTAIEARPGVTLAASLRTTGCG